MTIEKVTAVQVELLKKKPSLSFFRSVSKLHAHIAKIRTQRTPSQENKKAGELFALYLLMLGKFMSSLEGE